MGSPVWGSGYYQGSKDGYRTGFSEGGVVGAGLTLAAGALVTVAGWAFLKLQERHVARHERSLTADGALLGDVQDEVVEGGPEDS